MLKMYHYAPIDNNISKEGLKALCLLDKNLDKYVLRCGFLDKKGIISWLDNTFKGRSRSVSCLTEPIKWQGGDAMLKEFIDDHKLYSFDLEELLHDGIVEEIWCKDGSDAGGRNEKFYRVSADEIDLSPLEWEKCNKEKGLFFAVIRHYLLVLKEGKIPACYLTLEDD